MIATLSIRKDALRTHRNAAEVTSNRLLADRMGIEPSTLARCIAGAVTPSGGFIAALLFVLPSAQFEDLFELRRAVKS